MGYMAIRPILKTCISIYLTILSGISGKIIMDEQVRPGYPKENGLTKTADYLPTPISIRQDIEFAFSNWISYAYLGSRPNHKPFNPRRRAMKLSKVAKIWIDYHKTHSKKKYGKSLPGHHRTVYPGIR
jgi:hypothetical protein